MGIYETFVQDSFENFLHNLMELVNLGCMTAEDALSIADKEHEHLDLAGHYDREEM